MTRIHLKVCCIASVEEALIAAANGANALGLVSAMPSGPGVIGDAAITEIAASVPPPISRFLLTSRTTADDIAAQWEECRVDTIQLCDALWESELRALRRLLPGVRLVPVIHVGGDESIEEARVVMNHADALLLDSGSKSAVVKELGGTGRTHNWQVSRAIVDQSRVPVFLAGGLNPDNVVSAISTVRPFGIDVCSGVRSDGALDPAKLRAFAAAIARASSLISY